MDWIYLFQLFVVFSFDCVGVGRGKVTMVVWLPGSLWSQWWWCDDWSSWYCHAMSLPVLLPTSTHTHSQSPQPPPPPPPPLPPTVSTTPTAILGHQHQLAKMANIAAQQADFIFYLTLYLLSHSGWSLAERERERESGRLRGSPVWTGKTELSPQSREGCAGADVQLGVCQGII